MIPYQKVFDAFLAQIQDDEWDAWEDWQRTEDWKQLLLAALPWFKFPRVSLEMSEEGFVDDNITNTEIQIIVGFMKAVWLERLVNSWENLRPMYQERDFSPAKMLGEFRLKQDAQLKTAKQLEAVYYRSIKSNPYPYSNLSGGN